MTAGRETGFGNDDAGTAATGFTAGLAGTGLLEPAFADGFGALPLGSAGAFPPLLAPEAGLVGAFFCVVAKLDSPGFA